MKKDKLIFFCGTLTSGGAERVISVLSNSFIEYFNKVSIVLYYRKPIWYSINPAVDIICIENETKSNNIGKKALWFRRYIKEEQPTILISFLSPFNMFALVSLFNISCPIIVADRSDPNHNPSLCFLRLLRNFLYRFSNGIVLQSKSSSSYFSKPIQRKCRIINNPVFIDKQVGSALSVKAMKKIVTVGRLNIVKNHALLIDSFLLFHERFPEYQLVIYGEGELKEKLVSYTKEKKMEDIVLLAGPQSDILNHIVDAELFVLSSNFEGMPNALIEAMCLGLPCISTKVFGAVDLIIDGINGRLVDVKNKDELAQCMIELVSDKAKARRIALEAIKIADSLQTDYIVKEWIDYIEKCI